MVNVSNPTLIHPTPKLIKPDRIVFEALKLTDCGHRITTSSSTLGAG